MFLHRILYQVPIVHTWGVSEYVVYNPQLISPRKYSIFPLENYIGETTSG